MSNVTHFMTYSYIFLTLISRARLPSKNQRLLQLDSILPLLTQVR